MLASFFPLFAAMQNRSCYLGNKIHQATMQHHLFNLGNFMTPRMQNNISHPQKIRLGSGPIDLVAAAAPS
ncbi:hypothetical protein AT574_16490 [Phaeobacter inhibens]|nr:hypothetical protein AT574_16490 [Phaeobacter inhibens]